MWECQITSKVITNPAHHGNPVSVDTDHLYMIALFILGSMKKDDVTSYQAFNHRNLPWGCVRVQYVISPKYVMKS